MYVLDATSMSSSHLYNINTVFDLHILLVDLFPDDVWLSSV